jgi:hypothetical protein
MLTVQLHEFHAARVRSNPQMSNRFAIIGALQFRAELHLGAE